MSYTATFQDGMTHAKGRDEFDKFYLQSNI